MLPNDRPDSAAAHRHAQVIALLDGAVDHDMAHLLRDTWSRLERIAASPASHARAVRERMFWASIGESGTGMSPSAVPSSTMQEAVMPPAREAAISPLGIADAA